MRIKTDKPYRTLFIPALILFTVVLSGCGSEPEEVSGASEMEEQEKPVAVEVVTVQKGSVVPLIETAGTVKGLHEAAVVSETQGVIKEVLVSIGDTVEQGDPLLQVDDDIAAIAMEQARQQWETAQLDLQGVEEAFSAGIASRAELMRAQSSASGAEARFREARKRYEDSRITAPIRGYLADWEPSLTRGNYISPGTPVGRIVDLSGLRADVSLSEELVALVQVGTPANLTVAGRQLSGSVTAIALASDAATGSYRVIIESENPYGPALRSGMTAEISLNPRQGRESLIVPAQSLIDRESGRYVYRREDDKARLVAVRVGEVEGNRAEILEGLDEGDAVLVTGFSRLRDGALIASRFVTAEGETP